MFGIIEWVFSWFDYYFNFIINIILDLRLLVMRIEWVIRYKRFLLFVF